MDGNASDEDYNFEWNSEDDREIDDIPLSCSAVAVPGDGSGEASSSRSMIIDHFVGMGFSERLVVKVIREQGEDNEDVILETLLAYSALEDCPGEQVPESSPEEENFEPNDFFSDYDGSLSSDFSDSDIFSKNEDQEPMNPTVMSLVQMGYSKAEASLAVERYGTESSIDELADFIFASQTVKENDPRYPLEVHPRPESKKRRHEWDLHNKKKQRNSSRILTEDDELIRPPKPMIGYGVPFDAFETVGRTIPEAARGPPFFYYENIALAPKGVWSTLSRFLYDIKPEFVDSKYFSAANRKRGYVHNLPIENRFSLRPVPPLTINDALPMTRRWWPSWDPRTKLNCIQTCIACSKLTEKIRKILEDCGGEPPVSVQKKILEECRRWNLVWVGKYKLAPLEPDEVESILGFPRNHTRGVGMSRTERYKSLGNSFQLDTVAYHLSVLREMYPKGINVLSLFSGIGGAEVALHRLGIRLNNVVSVEISEVNRNTVRSWWEQTNQTGNLYDQLDDVNHVDSSNLESLMREFGGFDLVIGGSPCNNLAGANRIHRVGLEGKESQLFFDFFRILDLVRGIMTDM